MKSKTPLTQKGQSLVIIALAMVGFLAVLGLVLDGGNAFSKRRSAQNAADAGALAAVRVLCDPVPGGDTPDQQAEDVGEYYAVTENKADSAQVFPDLANREVTVIATIDVPTFFIHLIGIDEIPVEASATAGCFSPDIGRSLIPVAWDCKPPISGWGSESETCQQVRVSQTTAEQYADDQQFHPELYIIMDNLGYVQCSGNNNDPQCTSSDMICKEDDSVNGNLTCDLDGDGEIDWLGGGGRSWVDLDGTEPEHECNNTSSEGSPELTEQIEGESNCAIPNDTWVPETTGDISSLYAAVQERAETDPIVRVPVYNDFCDFGDPRYAPECDGKFLTGDDIYLGSANQPLYFRIETYAIFYITCVRRNNSDDCPGATRVVDNNPTVFTGGSESSFRSIEGVFIDLSDPGGGRCEGDDCADLGVHTYYLKR